MCILPTTVSHHWAWSASEVISETQRGIGSCAELETLGQSWDQSYYNIAIFMNIVCIYIYSVYVGYSVLVK